MASLNFGSGTPEGIESSDPGGLWMQTDKTTLWKKSAGTGTDTTGWLRCDLAVFNIRDYGAMCDGTTPDHLAWGAAIIAADAVNGVVYHPGGVSAIELGLALPANSQVQIVGGSNAIIRAIGEFPLATPMLEIESNVGTEGSRIGAVRDIRFEGNGLAAIGLWVNAVQRHFENLLIENCTKCGLYIPGAQNCTFLSINLEGNGRAGVTIFPDCNLCLDLGARNNSFVRCQLTPYVIPGEDPPEQGVYNLVICQSAVSEIADGEPPSFNYFYGCQIERTSRTAANLGAILQMAGRYNTFTSCLFNTQGERTLITVNDVNGYYSQALRLTDCILSGTAEETIAVSARKFNEGTLKPTVIFSGTTIAEGFATLFEVDDDCEIAYNGPIYHGVVPFIDPLGSSSAPGLVVQRALRMDGIPSNSTGIPGTYFDTVPWLYDGTNHAAWFYVSSYWRCVDAFRPDVVNVNVASGTLRR